MGGSRELVAFFRLLLVLQLGLEIQYFWKF